MHIFISGLPGSGKTTLIKKLIPHLKRPCGFFTEEIREEGKRIGFKIKSLDGQEIILAHKGFKSSLRVSGYGVNLKGLEEVIKEISQRLSKSQTVVVDEIGKMEWASAEFRDFVNKLFTCGKKIVGVIAEKGEDFDYIKRRKDILIFKLTENNFEEVFKKVLLAKDALSCEELRSLEEKAKEVLGLPESLLIENASRACLELLDKKKVSPAKVAILAGRGNNSADSLALARHLINRNIDVEVFLVLNNKPYNKEVEFQLSILKKILSSSKFKILNNRRDILSLGDTLAKFDLIVDGIFGIGFRPPLERFYQELITLVNRHNNKILAMDIPSGLPADSSDIEWPAVRAFLTATFLAPKISFFLKEGPSYTGEIEVLDIGVSRVVLETL